MTKPGPKNLITDVPGLRVGNAEDGHVLSGTTVLLGDAPFIASVDVRGGAPGTRDTDALAPDCLVEEFHGIVLSGGSVFGLAAADGVTSWLSERGVGLELGPKAVPVVPAAILFDLANGGDKDWAPLSPYAALGRRACENAGADFALGNAGAGMGATAGSLKGGLGSASFDAGGGVMVGALVAANPVGEVVMPPGPNFWAWALECGGELGDQPAPAARRSDEAFELEGKGVLGANTTIAVVATNAALSKSQAQRLAMMAHDGIARAVRPAHTLFDGDTIFAVSTGERPLGDPAPATLSRLGALAADCVARALSRAVFEADDLGDIPSYRSRYAAQLTGQLKGTS